MPEEVEQEEEETTNPLMLALEQVAARDTEDSDYDPIHSIGISGDDLAEFVTETISSMMSMHADAPEGIGRVIDMQDLGFLITMGVEVGVQYQKDRQQP